MAPLEKLKNIDKQKEENNNHPHLTSQTVYSQHVLFNSVDNAHKLVIMNAAMVWCFFIITNLKIYPKLMLSLI